MRFNRPSTAMRAATDGFRLANQPPPAVFVGFSDSQLDAMIEYDIRKLAQQTAAARRATNTMTLKKREPSKPEHWPNTETPAETPSWMTHSAGISQVLRISFWTVVTSAALLWGFYLLIPKR